MKITRTPKTKCPECNHKFDATAEINGGSPSEGDITLCVECATLLIFNKDLTVRFPTDKERIEYGSNPSVIHAQIIIQGMPGKQKWRHR